MGAAASKTNEQFILESFEAAYLTLLRSGELARRVAAAWSELRACRLCPRNCGVDRLAGREGFCKSLERARVTGAFAHPGEEACLSGEHGSGTIFFNRCNLRCVFCQNAGISQAQAGVPLSTANLAEAMLKLQACGCHNINFVSPSHVLPQILAAVSVAAGGGLRLPLVWNSGGYDAVPALALLDGVVDIYMPDFKFWKAETAGRFSSAADYPERARQALREMHRQTGVLRLSSGGLACRGVLIRHLVMPGLTYESSAIMAWIARELSPDSFVNIMAQYHPEHEVGARAAGGAMRFAEINRRPTEAEVEEVYAAARGAGLWRFNNAQPQWR